MKPNRCINVYNVLIVILIILMVIDKDMFIHFSELVLCNKYLFASLITLIAGLFGFTIAVIPLIMQLVNQNNNFINKLNENNNFNCYIKPLLNRCVKFLVNMFMLFVFIMCVQVLIDFKNVYYIKEHHIVKDVVTAIFIYLYLILIYRFLYSLYIFIKDIKSLVNIFLQTKRVD
ncbi:hypothetical protein CCY99_08480 [Helicobacter sp. 16-1353]|uniref:hypothetical protein n=1 Tax=Helicobacter sp. 16-1353 TaxID=2004996 RepID=UPI000DCD7400|nr:hypothetical protein [Helicobacter sp. 16-1353]RAX51827.1 hypothetical protein CCY99_08480 [Helicobacter sp. 16-1353]